MPGSHWWPFEETEPSPIVVGAAINAALLKPDKNDRGDLMD
jgi:hypothetical protein